MQSRHVNLAIRFMFFLEFVFQRVLLYVLLGKSGEKEHKKRGGKIKVKERRSLTKVIFLNQVIDVLGCHIDANEQQRALNFESLVSD